MRIGRKNSPPFLSTYFDICIAAAERSTSPHTDWAEPNIKIDLELEEASNPANPS